MRLRALVSFASLLVLGCGAKSGLAVPDGVPAGPDVDLGLACRPQSVTLEPQGAEVMFVIDRSGSMSLRIDAEAGPAPTGLSRWSLTRQALALALEDVDDLLSIGGKFFPLYVPDRPRVRPAAGCFVDPSEIDVPPARGNAERLVSELARTRPQGGTPTAVGLGAARDWFDANGDPDEPRFVVLATDGGPNCNRESDFPCDVCTAGGLGFIGCLDEVDGPYLCLDEDRTQDVIGELVERGIPVYVVGISDPTRPDLTAVLDRMALNGGRPRNIDGERRFYDVEQPEDLAEAFDEITDTIARCTLRLPRRASEGGRVEVRVGGTPVPQDASAVDGWDFTSDSRGAIALFGSACEAAFDGSRDLSFSVVCGE